MKSVAKIVLSVCFGALIFFPAETVAPEEKEDPSIRAAELMAIIEELKEHNEKLLAPPKEPESERDYIYGARHIGPLDGIQTANAAYIREQLGQMYVEIADCESNLRQFNEDGTVLISRTNDVGIMQINLAAHRETAERLGIDIYTLEGNVAYASILVANRGAQDWYMSRDCHGY